MLNLLKLSFAYEVLNRILFALNVIQALSIIIVEVGPSVHNRPVHRHVSNRRWLILRHPLHELHLLEIIFTKGILNLCLLDVQNAKNSVSGE